MRTLILAGLLAAGFIATGARGQSASNPYELIRRCENATDTPSRLWCSGEFIFERDQIKVDRQGNLYLIPQRDR